MSAQDPEATHDYSRERPARRGSEQPPRTPRERAPAGGMRGALGHARLSAGPALERARSRAAPAFSRVRARVGSALSRRTAPSPEVLRLAVAVVAGVAALLLVVAEFLPLIEVVVGTLATVQETVRGGANHGYTLGVLGTLGIIMSLGAARGSRPAAGALAVIGVAALVIAVGVDLPDTRATGSLPQSIAYEDARAQPAVGFFVEILAGAALLAAGGALLVLSGRSRREASAGREGEHERHRAEDSLWDAPRPPRGDASAA